jgi:hypothetical protein
MGNTIKRQTYKVDLTFSDVIDVESQIIMIIGSTKTGKTWLTKELLRFKNINEEDIKCGIGNTTQGFNLYKAAEGNTSNISIMDIEGLNHPENKIKTSNIDSYVLSLISLVEGVVILLTTNYDEHDELLICAISTIINLNSKFLVVHNYSADRMKNKLSHIKQMNKDRALLLNHILGISIRRKGLVLCLWIIILNIG